MKLLAWDTSSKAGTVVAMEWDERSRDGWENVRLVTELSMNMDTTASDGLMWGIDRVLESARWKIEEIDLFGVGVGPGSFTGIRIGVTTARTLAHTLKKPLIGVSSLAALARPAAQVLSSGKTAGKDRTVVIAATDAAKGELFALWGSARSIVDCVVLAEGDASGLWKRGVEESVLTPDDLITKAKKKMAEGNGVSGWAVVGEARTRYPELWSKLPRAKKVELELPFLDQVQGRYLGKLVWEGYQAGIARDPLTVFPKYHRESDAEVKLKQGTLAPQMSRE